MWRLILEPWRIRKILKQQLFCIVHVKRNLCKKSLKNRCISAFGSIDADDPLALRKGEVEDQLKILSVNETLNASVIDIVVRPSVVVSCTEAAIEKWDSLGETVKQIVYAVCRCSVG